MAGILHCVNSADNELLQYTQTNAMSKYYYFQFWMGCYCLARLTKRFILVTKITHNPSKNQTQCRNLSKTFFAAAGLHRNMQQCQNRCKI